MTYKTIIEKLVQDFVEAWNNNDMDLVANFIAIDAQHEANGFKIGTKELAPEKVKGKAKVLAHLKKAKSLFTLYVSEYEFISYGKTFEVNFIYLDLDLKSTLRCKMNNNGKFQKIEIIDRKRVNGSKITPMRFAINLLKIKIDRKLRKTVSS